MKIRFLNLSSDLSDIKKYNNAINKIFKSGQIVLGKEVNEFEKNLRIYTKRKYCIGVGSGTDALYLAIQSLQLKPGDEVITTCLSWISTTNAIYLNGLTPVFADIDNDLNISTQSVRKLISNKTKLILAVNFTGKLAQLEELEEIAKENSIYLIEDAAQSFGAIKNKRKSGSFGHISTFSHNPMKVLSALGEAGSVLTDDATIKNRLTLLRYSGMKNKELLWTPGLNARLDTVQAALLNLKLKSISKVIKKRRLNADYLIANLKNQQLTLPDFGEDSVFYTFTIKINNRNKFQSYLESKGIETKIQHKKLIPQQPFYKKYKADLLNAKSIVKKILCIPVHEKLSKNELDYIIETINSFYR